MIRLDLAALGVLAPRALPEMRTAFLTASMSLAPYGVLETRLRAEHFLAQVLHESGGLRVLKENLNYSAERLMRVWPNRFHTVEEAEPYAHQPERLANYVYGARMGNTDPGDGWKYIGRGLLMLTGKNGYRRVGDALDLDLLKSPELVMSPEHALAVAGVIWTSAGCNAHADADSLPRVTRAINGGLIGLVDRKMWLQKVRDSHITGRVPLVGTTGE